MKRPAKIMPAIPAIPRKKSSINKFRESKSPGEKIHNTEKTNKLFEEINLPKINKMH